MHKNRVVLKNVNIYQQGLADILIDEGRIIHISKEPGYEVGDAVCHDLKKSSHGTSLCGIPHPSGLYIHCIPPKRNQQDRHVV